jgi:cobalt/nickel transport protein
MAGTVAAAEEGGDATVGLPVEIEPLVRPFGLWAETSFAASSDAMASRFRSPTLRSSGRNDGTAKAPADAFVTQVIKADGERVFVYAMPRAGWWDFAALTEGDRPMKSPTRETVPVEQGALMWVKAVV